MVLIFSCYRREFRRWFGVFITDKIRTASNSLLYTSTSSKQKTKVGAEWFKFNPVNKRIKNVGIIFNYIQIKSLTFRNIILRIKTLMYEKMYVNYMTLLNINN